MITFFKIGGWGKVFVEPVEIERETEKNVWIGDRRRAKKSSYECYFPTRNEAYQHLIDKAERDIMATMLPSGLWSVRPLTHDRRGK